MKEQTPSTSKKGVSYSKTFNGILCQNKVSSNEEKRILFIYGHVTLNN